MEENTTTDTTTSSTNQKGKVKDVLKILKQNKAQKMLVYPLMVLLFLVAMWWIFAPSEKEQNEIESGFNTNIPSPTNNRLVEDKQKAYEEEQLKLRQAERGRMQDLDAIYSGTSSDDIDLDVNPSSRKQTSSKGMGGSRSRETMQASQNAYKDMNRTLGTFYESPKVDTEKEELKQQVEELTKQLEKNDASSVSTVDEQLALMEKSYELAAKYLPQNGVKESVSHDNPTTKKDELRNGKALVHSIGEVQTSVVSSLSQPMNDAEFISSLSQERNSQFHTAIGKGDREQKNTIKACIHDNQTIINGQAVRMRLLEPIVTNGIAIPRNTLITGIGKIQGERLSITIQSLEYQGMIIPVELTIMDMDGQEGIFIPGSMEMNAIKEVVANLGGNLGTTINLNQQSAKDQILTDLGKGTIQGVSQYISKKMRTEKVHLKANYQVMLYQTPR